MSVVRVNIQPHMLAWALDSTGLPEAELEKRFPKLPQWHSGETRPTLKQARELAKLAHIPFGRLLLDEPSGERVGVTDFRTVGNKAVGTVSANLRETIRSSQSRLAWYADFAAEEGIAPPKMYASATIEQDPAETAERTRELLGIERGTPGKRQRSRTRCGHGGRRNPGGEKLDCREHNFEKAQRRRVPRLHNRRRRLRLGVC